MAFPRYQISYQTQKDICTLPYSRLTLRTIDTGEMAERSKAHAWKVCVRLSTYRGFESLSLRQIIPTQFLVVCIGPFATICCEPRQVRKEATVATDSGAEMWLIHTASLFKLIPDHRDL
jgi:hypothetical protein